MDASMRWIEGEPTPSNSDYENDIDVLEEQMYPEEKREVTPEEARPGVDNQANTSGSEETNIYGLGGSGMGAAYGLTMVMNLSGDTDIPNTFDYPPVGKPLLTSFAYLLKEFPTGICVGQFLVKFKEMNGYYPRFENFGYGRFAELVEDYPEYFWTMESPLNETLIFPVDCKDRYSSAKELFLKIWEPIELLLQRNNYILNLREIPTLLEELLGYKIDPADWSIKKVNKYYSHMCRRLVNYKKSSKIMFIEPSFEEDSTMLLIQVDDSVPETHTYHHRRTERLDKEKKERKYLETKMKFETQLYSGEFVQPKDTMRSVLDLIKEGDCYKCLGGGIRSPGYFYVNIIYYWNALEEMMDKMQKKYNALERNLFRNKARHLTPGFLVSVRSRHRDLEWHRAKIISKINDKLFKVFYIDYGDHVDAEIHDIRYLLTEFLALRAQAVRCVAQVGRYYNRGDGTELNKNIGWSEKESRIFRTIVYDCDMAIQFKKKTEIDDEAGWEVFVHLLAEGNTVAKHHVERAAIQRCRQGGYVCYENEDTERKKNLEMSPYHSFD